MNCDQAFERLTDPAPGGDSALQDHLDHCPRCRDMAEILEPALRFVTGETALTWSTSAWEFPATFADKPRQPFLTEQAVRVAEEAAGSLSARKQRRQRARRNRWLAVGLLAPMVAVALFMSEQEGSRTMPSTEYNPSGPALGSCTRESVGMIAKRDDTDREISAYEVVRSCNVCHLLDRPVRVEEADPLKLRPADPREAGSHWQATPDAAYVSSGISLRRQVAAIASHKHAC